MGGAAVDAAPPARPMPDPPTSTRTLWRVTDRASFAALRTRGVRATDGPVRCTWLRPAPGEAATPPRAAFAVGRNAGRAVARNRIRRRLRAALRELAAAGRLPAGTYLLGGGAELAEVPWAALRAHVARVVDKVTTTGSAR